MKKKIFVGFVVLFLISGFIAVYGTQGKISCLLDHCGANCPYGMCVSGDDCFGCVIHGCWDSVMQQFHDIPCTNQ